MEWNEKLSDLELDDLLREWKVGDPPPHLRLRTLAHRRRIRAWLPALAAACLLAGTAVEVMRYRPVHRAAPVERAISIGSFEPIPYMIPLSQDESVEVVRMDIPVTALLAAGFRLPEADPTGVVTADVLVGVDGRPHAIRLVSAVSEMRRER